MNGLNRLFVKQQTDKIWIIEGLLLALIPFIAYTMHYMYRLGYAAFFDIPPALIPLGISSAIIWVMVVLYILFIYLYIVVRTLTSFLDIPVVGIISRVILFLKLSPLLLPKLLGKKWYAKVVLLLGEETIRDLRRQSYGIIATQVAIQVLIVVGIAAFLFVLPYQAGRAAASSKTTFYTCSVSDSAEKLVILDTYNDILVTAPLQDTRKLSNIYRIIHLSDIHGGQMSLENLGHIKP